MQTAFTCTGCGELWRRSSPGPNAGSGLCLACWYESVIPESATASMQMALKMMRRAGELSKEYPPALAARMAAAEMEKEGITMDELRAELKRMAQAREAQK